MNYFMFIIILILYLLITISLVLLFPELALTNNIAIILTGCIVLWYTWETSKLRKETYNQTKQQIKPLPIILIQGPKFIIKNIGNGTALSVTIERVNLKNIESVEYAMVFPNSPQILEKDKSQNMPYKIYQNGKLLTSEFKNLNSPIYTDERFTIIIKYIDINSNKYEVIETIEKKALSDLKVIQY